MAIQTFSSLIADLLKEFKFPPPTGPAQTSYTFHFQDKPDVRVVCNKRGEVGMMSEAARLSPPHRSELLLDLLALNRWDGSAHSASITVNPANGAVIVWAQQNLSRIDSAYAKELLQSVRKKVDAVRARLNAPVAEKRVAGGATLARMQRLRG